VHAVVSDDDVNACAWKIRNAPLREIEIDTRKLRKVKVEIERLVGRPRGIVDRE